MTDENYEKVYCPDCHKFLLKISRDSDATIKCWCRRCKTEKKIIIRANEPSV